MSTESNDDDSTETPRLSRREYTATLASLVGAGSAAGMLGSNSEITSDPLSGDSIVQPSSAIENALDLAGPLADRPSADVVPERYYAVTDAGPNGQSMKLTYSDGSSWSEVPIDAPSISTDELSSKEQNGVVNAAHSDFTEIQDAVQFASDNQHSALYIPAGTHVVTAPDPSSKGVDLDAVANPVSLVFGDGRASVIKLADTQDSDHDSTLNLTNGVTVQNLSIDGNRANQTDGGTFNSQVGISGLGGAAEASLRNVEIHRATNSGLWINGGTTGFEASGIYSHDNGHRGFQVRGAGSSDYSSGLRVANVLAENNGGASDTSWPQEGVVIGDYLEQSTFTNITAIGNTANGVRTERIRKTAITAVSINNGQHGFHGGANTTESQFTLYCSDNTNHGINISSAGINEVRAASHRNGGDGARLDVRQIADCRIVARNNDQHGVALLGPDLGGTVRVFAESNNGAANGYDGVHIADDSGGTSPADVLVMGQTKGQSSGVFIASTATNTHVHGLIKDGVTDNGTGTVTYT